MFIVCFSLFWDKGILILLTGFRFMFLSAVLAKLCFIFPLYFLLSSVECSDMFCILLNECIYTALSVLCHNKVHSFFFSSEKEESEWRLRIKGPEHN